MGPTANLGALEKLSSPAPESKVSSIVQPLAQSVRGLPCPGSPADIEKILQRRKAISRQFNPYRTNVENRVSS